MTNADYLTTIKVDCYYSEDTPYGRKSTDFSFLARHEGPWHREIMDDNVADYVKKQFGKHVTVSGIKYEELPKI